METDSEIRAGLRLTRVSDRRVQMCYVIPVVLYLFSDKDVLYRDGRNFWTLQQWSRPLASLALITLLIQMILGGFPTDPKKAGPQFRK